MVDIKNNSIFSITNTCNLFYNLISDVKEKISMEFAQPCEKNISKNGETWILDSTTKTKKIICFN